MGWTSLPSTPKLAGEFKSEQCAHTVAETGKGHIRERTKPVGQRPGQRLKISRDRLTQAPVSARELNRPDLDLGREAIWPDAEDGYAPASVREAEQPQLRARVRFSTLEPSTNLH